MTFPRPAQGRQLRIGVTHLAWLNIYQNLKQIIQDAIAPEMQGLKGEIKALSHEITALSQRIDSMDNGWIRRTNGSTLSKCA